METVIILCADYFTHSMCVNVCIPWEESQRTTHGSWSAPSSRTEIKLRSLSGLVVLDH